MPDSSSAAPALEKSVGHVPVVTLRVNDAPEPADPEILETLKSFPVPDISDTVGGLYTMDAGLKPLYSDMKRFAGTALTVKMLPGDNWAIHGAFQMAGAGHVLIVDWQGYHDACGSGGLSLHAPKERGMAGIVIDGAWRDLEEAERIGLPIVGRGVSPFSPSKTELGEINVPVSCGGVIVEPGDFIVADKEGVVVIPQKDVQRVIQACSNRVESTQGTIRSLGQRYLSTHAANIEQA